MTTYAAHVLGPNLSPEQTLPLTGIPSRARLSRDGGVASTTSFTAGDSYAGTSFSTRTVISTVGGTASVNLEDFALLVVPIEKAAYDDQMARARDRQKFCQPLDHAEYQGLDHNN